MKDIFIMTKGMGKVFLRFHVGKEDCSSYSWNIPKLFPDVLLGFSKRMCHSVCLLFHSSMKFVMKLAWIFLLKTKY